MDSKDIVIDDPIVCKKCGALDHYETGDDLILAVTARLGMLHALPKDVTPDLDSMTVVPVMTKSAFGEGLSGKESPRKVREETGEGTGECRVPPRIR